MKMKKLITSVIMIAFFVGGLYMSSCQKCATCQYTYTGLNGQQETFTYSEVCGNNGDVNDYKDACAAAAAAYTNGACTCVDN